MKHAPRTSHAPLVTHRHTKHETRLLKVGRGLRGKARINKVRHSRERGNQARHYWWIEGVEALDQ